jgi:hypothetical protein
VIELKAVTVVQAEESLDVVNAHFRPFIYQKLKGREFYFRFWDARVLTKFLPTCDKEQIRTFFEGLHSVIIADEENPGGAIRYDHDHGRLQTSPIPLSTVFGEPAASETAEVTISRIRTEDPGKPGKKPRTFYLKCWLVNAV